MPAEMSSIDMASIVMDVKCAALIGSGANQKWGIFTKRKLCAVESGMLHFLVVNKTNPNELLMVRGANIIWQ